MSASLTDTQSRGLLYIKQQFSCRGQAPTYREIATYMGYSAVGSAQDLVNSLKRKGFIEVVERNSSRSLILTPKAQQVESEDSSGYEANPSLNTFVVPCLGHAPAGPPQESDAEHIGTVRMSISSFMTPPKNPENLFAVKASGESMIGAGILDGDWVIVNYGHESAKGDIILARLDDGVTIKTLLRTKSGEWFLQPENSDYEPIYGSQNPFEVVGKVVALQRCFV